MFNSCTRHASLVAISGLALLLFGGTARAQTTSSITGTVTDLTGALIPNAKVTATNQATNATQTTTSNSDGIYDIPGLAVGSYALVVQAPGFRAYKKTGIVVNAAQTLRADVHLAVGAISQTVTVEANALELQSESNEMSTLISGQQVRNIETNGRNITSLETLGTGVSGNLPSFNGVTAQNSTSTISFNGERPDHNNFLVDGGEVYDRGSGGKLDVMPSPDAIGQFQLLSSNYPPDYGFSSGGTVLVEMKSGTRQFHGGAWEYDRNDAFDSDYYFSKLEGTPTPELRLNIFGYNLGGPVPGLYHASGQKTFFFYNEEWRRYIQGVTPTLTPTVPASDFPTAGAAASGFTYTPWNGGGPGIVPVTSDPAKLATYAADHLTAGQPFPGGFIPGNLLDPNALLFMSTGAIPAPNSGTAAEPDYTASPKQPTFVREEVIRIDHDFSQKYHLMGSWIHDAMSQTVIPTQWSGDSYDTVGDVFGNPSWAAAIRFTQEISPTVLNETGLYVNGNTINVSPYGTYAQPSGWSANSFFPGNNLDNRMPQIAFTGGPINTTWTEIYWPWKNAYLDYQIRDDLSWTKGKHSYKFGFSYMREDKNQQLQADTEGDYTFNGSNFSGSSYLNFLLGFASNYAQLQAERTDHWLSNNYAFYAMDNWHLTGRFSAQLGFRYDIMPHTYEKNNQVANFVAADFNAATAQTPSATTGDLNPAGPGFQTVNGVPFYLNGLEQAGVNGFPRGAVQNDYYTLEPRAGFAWDFSGNGKTVLRAGAGIFYERMQGNDIYNLDTNPPFSYQPSVTDVYFSSPQTSDETGATAAVPSGPVGMSDMSYYYPHPGTLQYSLGIQQQLAPSVIAAVEYVGSGSWNQDDLREINDLPLSATAERESVAMGTAVAGLPTANANYYRPYAGYSNIRQEEDGTNANYNSLQAALRMDNRHGLTVQLAYTWSHEIDIESADLTTDAGEGTGGTLSDPYNPRYDRGSGLFDRRNLFNANYIYALPFYRHSNNGFAREALAGWSLSGVTQAESGSPQNIYYNGPDILGLGGNATSRPNIVGHVSFPKTQKQWFSTSSFAPALAPWAGGTTNGFGNAGKDTIVQPGLFNWNLSAFKDFPLSSRAEGPRLQFRAESYNTFNHTEFDSIDTGTTDGNYGQVTNTYDPRELQFGAKFLF